MKAYFDVHGALTVEGEDPTEWLALRTWAQCWTDNTSPLWIAVKGPDRDSGFPTSEHLQMYRAPGL